MAKSRSLTVSVLRARGLVSSKGADAPVSSYVSLRLPFSDAPLHSDVHHESSAPEYLFEPSFTIEVSDESLTALLCTPLVLQLLEPDETSLGQLSIGWAPLLESAEIERAWLPVGAGGAEVLVGVSSSEPLLSEEEFEDSSMLEMSVLSMHSLPLKWVESVIDEASHIFTYKVKVALPLVEGLEPFEFVGGKMVTPPTPLSSDTGAPPAIIEEEEEEEEEEDEEEGGGGTAVPEKEEELVDPQDLEHKIQWSGATLKRFLNPSAVEALREALEGGQPIAEITITRLLKAPEAVVDSNFAKYAALVQPAPADLVESEVTSAEVKVPVLPHPDPPRNPALPPEGEAPVPEKKGKGKNKGPEVLPVEEVEEVHPYEVACTTLKLRFKFSRPLVPRPPTPPPPLPKVSDLVPKRVLPQFAAKTAAAEYQAQITSLVETLVADWSSTFPELDLSQPTTDAEREERRKALLFKLNSEGKYWTYKERLKRCVVRIVKETMNRPSAQPLDSHSMQTFYNDLYVTLTQQLHTSLNQIFFPKVQAPTAPSAPDDLEGKSVKDALKLLATEMEMLFRYDKAAIYHQERVASCKYDASVWYDYALFLMRNGEAAKAEECAKEAVALRSNEVDYLFAYGCILTARAKYNDAEVFLKESLNLMPQDVELWLLISIMFSKMGRGRDARAAIKQAKEVQGSDELSESFYQLAFRCLKVNARPIIEAALEQASLAPDGAKNHTIPLCAGKMLLCCGEYEKAAAEFEAALKITKKSVSGWTMLGHARLLLNQTDEAKTALAKALDLSPQPQPLAALLHLGNLCLADGEFARAKELYILACRQQPSCSSWLGVGTACLNLHQLDEAEEALAEANVLNNREERVWAYLALLCVQQKRFAEGEQALKQALKLELADGALLSQVGEAFLAAGKWSKAEECLRRATAAKAQGKTYRLLADCLYEQSSLQESLQMYEKALRAGDLYHDAAEHCEARKRQLKKRLGV